MFYQSLRSHSRRHFLIFACEIWWRELGSSSSVVLPLFNYKVQHFGEIIDVISVLTRPPDMRPLGKSSSQKKSISYEFSHERHYSRASSGFHHARPHYSQLIHKKDILK